MIGHDRPIAALRHEGCTAIQLLVVGVEFLTGWCLRLGRRKCFCFGNAAV